MDDAVIQLLCGTTLHLLQVVVDNSSGRLLAWKLAEKLRPTTTCEISAEAANQLPATLMPVTAVADSGVQNVALRADV